MCQCNRSIITYDPVEVTICESEDTLPLAPMFYFVEITSGHHLWAISMAMSCVCHIFLKYWVRWHAACLFLLLVCHRVPWARIWAEANLGQFDSLPPPPPTQQTQCAGGCHIINPHNYVLIWTDFKLPLEWVRRSTIIYHNISFIFPLRLDI